MFKPPPGLVLTHLFIRPRLWLSVQRKPGRAPAVAQLRCLDTFHLQPKGFFFCLYKPFHAVHSLMSFMSISVPAWDE